MRRILTLLWGKCFLDCEIMRRAVMLSKPIGLQKRRFVGMLRRMLVAAVVISTSLQGQARAPLLREPVVDALANGLSGERALETIKGISANHRVRGSRPFRAAAS